MTRTVQVFFLKCAVDKPATAVDAVVVQCIDPGIQMHEQNLPVTGLYNVHIPDWQIFYQP
ncbi:MAG: hypothetical protein WC598_11110 [Methanoregula sp.]